MNLLIFFAFCVIAVNANDDEASLKRLGDRKMVKIPDGFGGMKVVDLEAETEIDPKFDIQNDVRFLVFTRRNPTVGQEVRFNDMGSVTNSNFLANQKTVFIIHGWQSDINTEVNPLLTFTYLTNSDCNIVVVDWSIGAASLNYITSRNHVNGVGAHVAVFIDNLHAAGLLTFNQLTCAGKSLGAHVCGATGKRTTRGRMDTIFGLDPAGPLFLLSDPDNRLASGDADYVENVHTDTVALGIGDAIGDVDYYPNGGMNQPGCTNPRCDHATAPRFLADTLQFSGLLWGRRCANLAEMDANQCTGEGFSMGGNPSNRAINLRGIFRMATNENSPIGQGPF